VFSQKYKNFHVIYIDDASTDGTASLVEEFIKKNNFSEKCTVIKNSFNQGILANRCMAVSLCNDTDICLALDGDDWLPHDGVLSLYNTVYSNKNVWLTYGSYVSYPSNKLGDCCGEYPSSVIAANAFRKKPWKASHMRTCYAWLFKHINIESLKEKGVFIQRATDRAMTFPMLEMAGYYSKFIPDITYIYNEQNPLSFFKNPNSSDNSTAIVAGQKKYKRIKIALLQHI
jgi:glycosyltransferase involved in cell wall biosynthesis